MKKLSFIVPALLLVLSACNNDIETVAPTQNEVILTASMETSVASRTNFTTSGDFFWTTGDKIKVYGTNSTFSTFKVISGAGTGSATFSGTMSGSTSTCAVYPADAAKSVSGTTLTFEAPSSYWYEYEQSEFVSTMVPNVNSTNVPMVAKIATVGSANLNFKNLGGAFCFKFKDVPANTSKIVFTANSKICGSFTVDLGEATPTINTSATSSKKYRSIAVEFDPSDVKTDRVVYIPVPCGTYEGYEVEMYDEEGNTTAYLESDKTKVVERSAALRFNNVTVTTLSGGIEGEDTPSNMINDHEYVDLGLPSGLKWATCNIGADTPSDYGDYFAWGETATKPSYVKNNSIWYGMASSELKTRGVIDNNCNLTSQYDTASVIWKGTWRMPTKSEIGELRSECTWTWENQDGHNGYRVTGNNERSIFLPAAGWLLSDSPDCVGTHGEYWSASVAPYTDYGTCALSFHSSDYYLSTGNSNSYGMPIRPVTE